MNELIFLTVGLVLGAIIIWAVNRFIHTKKYIGRDQYESLKAQFDELKTSIVLLEDRNKNLAKEIEEQDNIRTSLTKEKDSLSNELSAKKADLQNKIDLLTKAENEIEQFEINIEKQREKIEQQNASISSKDAEIKIYDSNIKSLESSIQESKKEFQETNKQLSEVSQKSKQLEAENTYLKEKLDKQKEELEDIGQKFTNEFKVLADKILEDKSQRFTELNKTNLNTLLEPLGKNITEFKQKVEETYDKESKQRFSLEEKIKDLVQLNQKISEEANNLTKALKGQAKTQGDWGEMILESILEKSGLVKGREYFVQEFIKAEDGSYVKNEAGEKLKPDVLIAYPDNRKVIIDSKVSLNAYDKYVASDEINLQNQFVQDLLKSIRNHIDNLSIKNYQDFTPSLDFVMMFVPIEPAYLLAIQNDPDLWNYAYTKRILLISPTNLIAALKIVVDLWKREYQNRYAIEIAEKSGQLYDKFVGFVEDLTSIGDNIDKTQKSYLSAFNKLKDGRGNLISRSEKLKLLGAQAKKSLPAELVNESTLKDDDDNDEQLTLSEGDN